MCVYTLRNETLSSTEKEKTIGFQNQKPVVMKKHENKKPNVNVNEEKEGKTFLGHLYFCSKMINSQYPELG